MTVICQSRMQETLISIFMNNCSCFWIKHEQFFLLGCRNQQHLFTWQYNHFNYHFDQILYRIYCTSMHHPLNNTLNLLQDISQEYYSSVQSLEIVQQNYTFMSQILSSELSLRQQERKIFLTKAGTKLRDLILTCYRSSFHEIFQSSKLFSHLFEVIKEEHRCLKQLIFSVQPAIVEIQNIEQTLKNNKKTVNQLNNKINNYYRQGQSYNGLKDILNQFRGQQKDMFQTKPGNNKKDQIAINLLNLHKQIAAQQAQFHEQTLSTQMKELHNILETSIFQISNLQPIQDIVNQHLYQNNRIQQSSPFFQKKINKSEFNSLGIESLDDKQMSLYCQEEIQPQRCFLSQEELQKITEREEYSYSEGISPVKESDR